MTDTPPTKLGTHTWVERGGLLTAAERRSLLRPRQALT